MPARMLGPPPGSRGGPALSREAFVTGSAPGRIEHLSFPGEWALDLGAPAGAEYRTIAHGLFVTCAEEGCATVVEPGVLVADLPSACTPRFVCEGYSIRREGDASVLEISDTWMVLRTAARDGRLRLALVCGSADLHDALARVERHLESHASRELARAHAPYEAFWQRQAGLSTGQGEQLAAAADELAARLRPPAGSLAFSWSESDLGYPGMATADLLPLTRAWSVLQPRVAADLVKTLLSAQREDGSLPAAVRPDGVQEGAYDGPPLIAQSALAAWQAAPSRDFFDFALPRLHRYLQWAIRRFDPGQNGLALWPTDREAFLPATRQDEVATPDLPAFLCAEIDALAELAASVTVGGVPMQDLEAYRARLLDTLTGFFWNEAASLFKDRRIEGEFVARETLSGAVPLLATTLPAEFRLPLVERLTAPSQFLTAAGWQAWLPWAADTEPPPVLASHQMILLTALERHATEDALAAARESLLAGISRPADAADAAPGASVARACMTILLLAKRPSGLLESTPISPLLVWMDRYRTLVASAVTLAVLGLLGVVIAGSCSKKALTRQAVETTAGLARRYYSEARYDEAIALFREIADSGRSFPGLHVALGNAEFRAGRLDRAEKAYRDELARDPAYPPALQNLALALLHAGRTSEAVTVWQQATNDLAIVAPAVAARARTALTLLETCPPTLPGTAK